MSAPGRTQPDAIPARVTEPDDILRFRASERHMHWAVAVPFMVCYATAAVLMLVYNPDPQRPLRAVLSWAHRVSGVGLILLPAWALVRHWYDVSVHVRNTREAWKWTLADVAWLCLMGPSTVFRRITLPEQGKFNAAEKINFMVLTATVPLYAISGLLLWFHQYAFLAWVLHLSMAALATPLIVGHLFMAVVNPDTRVGLSGMITGFVSRRWASHHYARWYKENFEPVAEPVSEDAGIAPVAPELPEAPASTWPPVTAAAPPFLRPAQPERPKPGGWRRLTPADGLESPDRG